ncbi:hypothetical protein Daus18300_013201 [Diaporthe australafricana]|uniref:DUF4211 domain-containing protein n=1 Tax=Diaporthe australafricana TaxID=127596 RepID=A0ABR3W020_9PEZI
MTRSAGPKQQTLDASLGKANPKESTRQLGFAEGEDENEPVVLGHDVKVRQRQPPSPPTSSFISKSNKASRRIVDSDSDTSVEEDGEPDDTDGEGPSRPEITRRGLSRPTKRSDRPIVVLDDSDDDEPIARSSQSLPNQAAVSDDSDAPLVTPRSSMRQKGQIVVNQDEGTDDDEDEEEVQSPAKRRKLARIARQSSPVASSDGLDSQSSRSNRQVTPPNKKSASPQTSNRKMRSSARKGHRSEKEKKLELLRRRRAGEKELTMTDLETSDDEGDEDQGGLYDTDSDHQVLDVFEDESDVEPAEAAAPAKESKKAKKKQKSQASSRRNEDEDDSNTDINGNLPDFVDDNDDTIGVPDEALYQMPLEFTRASHKPLKAHFKDAVEWLVHRRINTNFEKDDEVYKMAWKRLDDEMVGLAQSKFISSGWKSDFLRSLKARPHIEVLELGPGHLSADLEKCEACGRSNHPATWVMCFRGKPYDSYLLDELDYDTTSDSEEEEADEEEHLDRDKDGNSVLPEDKQFFLGTVCNSNAEAAHGLLHWKPALRDYVYNTLQAEGWLAPEKLAERDQMKPKRRRKLADGIVEGWDERGTLKRLWADFKHTLEVAQTQDTTKASRGGRKYGR